MKHLKFNSAGFFFAAALACTLAMPTYPLKVSAEEQEYLHESDSGAETVPGEKNEKESEFPAVSTEKEMTAEEEATPDEEAIADMETTPDEEATAEEETTAEEEAAPELSREDILKLNRVRNRYSRRQIEDFVREHMQDGRMEVTEETVENDEDFEKLVLAYDFSTRKDSFYQVKDPEPEEIDNGRYRYPRLTFEKKTLRKNT